METGTKINFFYILGGILLVGLIPQIIIAALGIAAGLVIVGLTLGCLIAIISA